MKLQLDTTNKTIRVEERVRLSELIKIVKKILPNEWKDFILETNTTIINWHEPIIIKEYPPYRPWKECPWYFNSSSTGYGKLTDKNVNYQLKSGVFNLECKGGEDNV